MLNTKLSTVGIAFLGQPSPDIAVYDAQGKLFSLSNLKENYSVLVFGCLT